MRKGDRRDIVAVAGRVSLQFIPAATVAMKAAAPRVTKMARQPNSLAMTAPTIGPSAGTNARMELNVPYIVVASGRSA
ncbi:hypothetical protein D3C87_1456530 [compost metagenome]